MIGPKLINRNTQIRNFKIKFNPLSIPNMALWLKADAGITLVGGNVDAWADQSGQGQNFAAPAAINRPAFTGTINGITTPRFNGTNSVLRGLFNNNLNYTGPLTIVLVVRKNATAYNVYETILSAGATGSGATNNSKSLALLFGNNPTYFSSVNFATDIWYPSGIKGNTAAAVSTKYRLFFTTTNLSTHRTIANSKMEVNDINQTLSQYNTQNPTGLNTNPFQVGAFDYLALPTSFFAGDIGEILVYKTQLTAYQKNALNKYIINKWGT